MPRDPYALLGASRKDSDAKIDAAKMRALEMHDDPAKRAEVADAYDRILAERGRKPPTADPGRGSLPGRDQSRRAGIVVKPKRSASPGRNAGPSSREVSARERNVALGPDIRPDLSLPDIVRRMRAIEAPLIRSRLEQCLADRKLGLLWIIAQKAHAEDRGNLPAKKFARFKFGIPYERLRLCAKLAEGWPEFVPAHRWLTSKGARAAGWVAKEPTGAPYGLEAMRLHRDFNDGLGPTDREDAKEARRQELEEQRAAGRAAAQPEDAPPGDLRRAMREKEAEVAALDEARRDATQEAEWAKAGAAVWKRRAERRARWLERWVRTARHMKERAERAEARLREPRHGT